MSIFNSPVNSDEIEDNTVEEESTEKFLTQDELNQLDINHLKQKIATLQIELLREAEDKRRLETKIYQAQAETLSLRIELLGRPDPLISSRSTAANAHWESLKEESAEFISSLKEKYGIKGKGLGYDPETGKLIEDEEQED